MTFIKASTLFVFVLSLCVSMSVASFAEPPNLSLLREKVKTYHDSGDYEKELAKVSKEAQAYINVRAKSNALSKHPKKLAIVLDIDETVLTNYKKMVARNFIATSEQFHKEISSADAPAIQPMLSLYHDALKHGVTVFFVTGRNESVRYATRKNLQNAGFHTWGGLYLKPNSYNKSSTIPYKSKAREVITRKGYTIIATIGDQYSDLKGGFAEKGFKLPNPYYYLP